MAQNFDSFWGLPVLLAAMLLSCELPEEVQRDVGKLPDGSKTSCNVEQVILDGVTSIKDREFSEKKLKSVRIPDSVTAIKYGAFSYNNLEYVTIPPSVTLMEKKAFYYNTPLKEVILPVELYNKYIHSDVVKGNRYSNFDNQFAYSVGIDGSQSEVKFYEYDASKPDKKGKP